MSSTTNALVLGDGAEVIRINDPEHDICSDYGEFTSGYIDSSNHPQSFYVVYDQIEYGTTNYKDTKTALVPGDPFSGSSSPVQFNFTAGSAQGFDIHEPGIVLFQHPNYIGNGKQYRSSRSDITASFPACSPDGVSSVMVMSGKWALWGNKNFQPPRIKTVEAGDMIADLGAGDDKVKSIERLQY